MMKMVKGISHIGIPCENLQKSMKFYQELGFDVQAHKNNLDGFNVAMMQAGSCIVELYQSVNKVDSPEKNGMIDHIALKCEDVEKVYVKCLEMGKTIITDIEETKIYSPAICRYFYILGPDGERIELIQTNC